MKKQNKNIREPFEPEKTPKPPQIIDPNTSKQRENPIENKGRNESSPSDGSAKSKEKQHLLSEDADIDDETTV